MSYIVWMVAWFLVQRLMMVLGIVQTNALSGTLFLTLIGFAACWFTASNIFCIGYFIWVIAWGIGHIVHGGLLGVIPGVLVIAFHIGLFFLVIKRRNPTVATAASTTSSTGSGTRRRTSRRRRGYRGRR